MQLSAEIRWFWQNTPPANLESWFRNPGAGVLPPGGGGEPRGDEYLREEDQCELGVKIRGRSHQGVEIKGLVAAKLGELSANPFSGSLELWCKWRSSSLDLKSGSTIMIRKWRLLRKFDTGGPEIREVGLGENEMPKDPAAPLPEQGCNVELTRIHIPANGQEWWTLGFESFGSLGTVEESLRSAATTLAALQPPGLDGGLLASYPAWLKARILPTL